jgi:hypothetical protein
MQRVLVPRLLQHSREPVVTFRSRPSTLLQSWIPFSRPFSSAESLWKQSAATDQAKRLSQQSLDEQESEFKDGGFDNQIDNAIGAQKELQARTPWHREGSDKPPVKRLRSAGAMTKGLGLFTCAR